MIRPRKSGQMCVHDDARSGRVGTDVRFRLRRDTRKDDRDVAIVKHVRYEEVERSARGLFIHGFNRNYTALKRLFIRRRREDR